MEGASTSKARAIRVTLEAPADSMLVSGGDRQVSVGPVMPVALSVEGNDRAKRLLIEVDCFVLAADGSASRLRGELVSEAWAAQGGMPPVTLSAEDLAPEVEGRADTPLAFTFVVASPPRAMGGDPHWLRFLSPGPETTTLADDGPSAVAGGEMAFVEEALPGALANWLRDFPAATVGEAVSSAVDGPVGHFGPVESRVLRRTGQANLAVDVTLLGKADNADEMDGAATRGLSLYGERFGQWLLHRWQLQPVRSGSKKAPSQRVTHDVVVAPSAERLVEQAGLDDLEKGLFERVGILPPVPLWLDAAEGNETDGDSVAATVVDLSGLADRPRRHLQALISLARQGKLDGSDTDFLLRAGRHLARHKR